MRYLEEIAKEYNVEWVYAEVGVPLANGIYSDEEGSRLRGAAPVAAPTGYSIPMAPGSNLGNAYSAPSPTEKSKMQEEKQQQERFEQQQLQFQQQQQQFQQQQLQLQQLQQQDHIKQQEKINQQQLQQQQQQQLEEAANRRLSESNRRNPPHHQSNHWIISNTPPPPDTHIEENPSAPIPYAEAILASSEEQADMPPAYEAVPVAPASRFNDLAARFEALQKKNWNIKTAKNWSVVDKSNFF